MKSTQSGPTRLGPTLRKLFLHGHLLIMPPGFEVKDDLLVQPMDDELEDCFHEAPSASLHQLGSEVLSRLVRLISGPVQCERPPHQHSHEVELVRLARDELLEGLLGGIRGEPVLLPLLDLEEDKEGPRQDHAVDEH